MFSQSPGYQQSVNIITQIYQYLKPVRQTGNITRFYILGTKTPSRYPRYANSCWQQDLKYLLNRLGHDEVDLGACIQQSEKENLL